MTINAPSRSVQLTPGAGGEISSAATVSPGESWQLADGHWMPRKFDMVIAHPRPDTETNTYAQHRNAYPGVAWDTRILVWGGAYPFYFELIQAPSGMTIGQSLSTSGDVLIEGAAYGKLSWASPTVGSHTVTVRVYDQDYNRATNPSQYSEITFTLVVGTSSWVFIDPVGGNNSNDGTLASPFLDTTNFTSGSTYADKLVMIRAGTMNLVGMGGSNYTFNGSQPGVFLGYPGETAVINFNAGHFSSLSSGVGDFCLRNLTLRHDSTTYGNAQKMFVGGSGADRAQITDCIISQFKVGGTGTAGNPAIMYISAGPNIYSCFAYNTLSGTQGPAVQAFQVDKMVIHGNTWSGCTFSESDSSNLGVIFFKDGTMGASVRKNVCWQSNTDPTIGAVICFRGQNQLGLPYGVEKLEICYNTFTSDNTANRAAPLREMTANAADSNVNKYYFYRNSFSPEDNVELNGQTVTNSARERNVLSGGAGFDPMQGATDSDNLESGTYLDANMKLTAGAIRTAWLGLRGAEVV